VNGEARNRLSSIHPLTRKVDVAEVCVVHAQSRGVIGPFSVSEETVNSNVFGHTRKLRCLTGFISKYYTHINRSGAVCKSQSALLMYLVKFTKNGAGIS
jgi:hypothetical protein